MAKSDRESRDSKIPMKTFLHPFDASKFGSEDDPCFAKLYDLSAMECQECGDIEVCAIAFANNQHIRRELIEKDTKFKDLEESEVLLIKRIKEYASKLEGKGKTPTVIRIKVANKFGKPKQYIKQILG